MAMAILRIDRNLHLADFLFDVLVGGSFCSAKELWKPLPNAFRSSDRDCLVGAPTHTLSAKRQIWNP
jgi:hypothetical protein